MRTHRFSPVASALLASALLALAPSPRAQCAAVHDINPGANGSFPQGYSVAFGQELYFLVSGATPGGSAIWKWSASGGAVPLVPGLGLSNVQDLTPCCTKLGPRVFFVASKSGLLGEPWITDGTTAGTMLLRDLRPSSASNANNFIAVDGRVFFEANDGTNGDELWISDGTSAGTQLVQDINPGPSASQPDFMVELNGVLVFSAFHDSFGRELWASDGTAAGTILLADIAPGTDSGLGVQLVRCGDFVYFAADDGTTGFELWRTDGTPAGTVLVEDIAPGLTPSSPINLACCGDTLFFNAQVTGIGREPWVSDGTAGGTVLLKDCNPAAGGSSGPKDFTCAGDRMFFAASENLTGTELWVSDGTTAGTYAIDVRAGASSSFPQLFTPAGTGVCFRATGPAGSGIWFSDGTVGGTFEVCGFDPGSSRLHSCAGHLFFSSTDATAGNELCWIPTPGATTTLLGCGGLPDRPTLVTGAGATPVLGGSFDLVAAGPAGHVGYLFVGPALLPNPPLPPFLQGGCDFVGLLSGAGFAVAVTAAPTLTVPVAVPALPSLEGVALAFQMVWLDAGAVPPLQMSNGVQLVFGTAQPH